MRGKRKAITITLVLIVIAAIVCGIIFIPKWFSKTGTSVGKRVQMNTVTLEKTDLTESVSATGTIGSGDIRLASAQVQELKVKNVLVQVGDTVQKGQTLVTFNTKSLKQALKQAKEDYEDAQSGSSSGVRTVTLGGSAGADDRTPPSDGFSAGGQSVTPSAVQPVQTAQPVTDQPVVGQPQTNTQSSRTMSQPAYQQTLAGAGQTGNTSSLTQAKRALQEAKQALKNAVIKAPISGTVTALGVEKGSIYSGGDAVQISDLTKFQVSATIDEYNINNIEKGQRVVILTDATGDEEIEGEITYVALTTESSSLSVNTSSGGSGNMGAAAMGDTSGSGYAVTIALQKTDAKIRSGMTAKCSIITKEVTDVYAVPYDAIHSNNKGESYIIAMDSSGNRKEITVEKGMESDYLVEISSGDLTDGMTVLIPSDEVSVEGSDESEESQSSDTGLGGLMGGGPGGDMGGPPGDFSGGDFSPPDGFSDGNMPEPPSGGFPGGGFPGGGANG